MTLRSSFWREKANRIIAELCLEAWRKANHDRRGKRFKKHHPYQVPADAQALIEALKKDDEIAAKAIFIRHAYGIVHR